MTQQGVWREVSKREQCPVCEKQNWCSITGPDGALEAAVCMRVEFSNARPNGGWLHRLRDSTGWQPPRSSEKPKLFGAAREAIAALTRMHSVHSRAWKYFDAAGEPVGVVVRWDKGDEKNN